MATEEGSCASIRLEEPPSLPGHYGNTIPVYGLEFAKLGKINPEPLIVDYTKPLKQLQCFVWNFSES